MQTQIINFIFLTLLLECLSVAAQSGPQATLLPACIKTCDPPAIASVNCTNSDQYCHCVRQDGILSNITSCADKICVNPSASLYIFTTLFGEVCAPFNITVPVLGSNSSANGTDVSYPSGVPFTGGGDRSVGNTALWVSVLGVGGFVVFGFVG